MEKLKIEVEKMTEKAERKNQIVKHIKKEKEGDEDIDNLLSSIKAKVSIIELYKKWYFYFRIKEYKPMNSIEFVGK